MDAGTPRLWRRRTIAAVGTLGIAITAGGGLFFPGVAAADAAPTSRHWDFTGEDVTDWTVPPSVCAVDWTLRGGSGGAGINGSTGTMGGLGGTIQASIGVTPGQPFVIQVGGAGDDASTDGATGGKSGAQPSGGNASGAGGAGGGATVVRSGTTITDTPVLVAGGGGGGGGISSATGGNGGNPATKGSGVDADDASLGGGAGTNTSGSTDEEMVGADAPEGVGAGGGGLYRGGFGTAVAPDGTSVGGGGGGGANSAAGAATGVTHGTAGARGNGSVDAVFTPCVADAPTLRATSTDPGKIVLDITPGDDTGAQITGYEYRLDGGAWTPLDLPAAGGTATVPADEGADVGVEVHALTPYEPSAASNKETLTVAETPVPGAPTITGSSTHPRQLDLFITPVADDQVPATSWEVTADGGDHWNPLTTTADEKTGVLSATAEDLDPGVFDLAVRAVNGPGEVSNTIRVTVVDLPDAPVIDFADSTAPGSAELLFTPGTTHGIDVQSWEYSTGATGPWQALPVASGGTDGQLKGTIPGLDEGKPFTFYVRAVTAEGTSEASDASAEVTVEATPVQTPVVKVPGAPSMDKATSDVVGQVQLTFTPGATNGASITGYEYSLTGDQWTGRTTTAGTGDQRVMTVDGLTPGGQYTFYVRTVTADAHSEASTASSKVTVKSPPVVVPTPTPTPINVDPVVVKAPGAPTGVSGKAGTAQVAVSWAAPAAGAAVDHYVATLTPGGQSCTTKELSCKIGASDKVGYSVTVVAVSADGVTGPGASASVSGTAAAPAVPAEVPSTALTLTTDKGAITSATPGQKITVVGTGFLPFSTATVVIYSDPIVLGTVVTDANGNFAREVEVPDTLAAGQHHLVASGVAPDGSQRFLRMDVTVAAASASGAQGGSGVLAWTGFEALPWTLGGVGAMALGAGVLLVARRRREAQG